MSSGDKRLIWNSRERALSTDLNNAEGFAAQQRATMFRSSHGVRFNAGGDNINLPGGQRYSSFIGTDTSDKHDCLAGLMVRPDAAVFLLIDEGMGGFNVTNASFPGVTADDSPYIMVRSPGVTSITQLTFTANGGAGVRYDVVECQPVDTLISSSSRDIFDPVTGLFTPAIVEKVRQATLTFRIRLGTDGAGITAANNDWMPLAVIGTPNTAIGFTQCDVWDVRNLLETRAVVQRGSAKTLSQLSVGAIQHMRELFIFTSAATATGTADGLEGRGYFMSEFQGQQIGGLIHKNVGNALVPANFAGGNVPESGEYAAFDPADTENQSSAGIAAPTASRTLALCCLFPSGYTRWVRYSQSSITAQTDPTNSDVTGRQPNTANGTLIVADLGSISPNLPNGVILDATGVLWPAQMDAASTLNNWGVLWGYAELENVSADIMMPVATAGDLKCTWATALNGVNTNSPQISMATGAIAATTVVSATYQPGDGGLVDMPIHARAVLMTLRLTVLFDTIGAGVEDIIQISTVLAGSSDNTRQYHVGGFSNQLFKVTDNDTASIIQLEQNLWVPVYSASDYNLAGGPDTEIEVRVNMPSAVALISSIVGTLFIRGYQL